MEYYDALKFALTEHRCIRRKGWNASNQFVFFMPMNYIHYTIPEQVTIVDGGLHDYHTPGILCIRTTNMMIIPWLCSATDAVASDWEIVPTATKDDESKPHTVDDLLAKNEEQLKREAE